LVERPIEVVEYQRLALSVTVVDRHTQQHGPKPSSLVKTWGEFTSPTRALGNYGHLSYEKQELMPELGDIDIGVGTLQATNARMAMVVEDSIEQLGVESSNPLVHVDESPWPVGLKEWLWVTTGQEFCLFHAGDTRSRPELTEQLGGKR